jgi:hypothetical protein
MYTNASFELVTLSAPCQFSQFVGEEKMMMANTKLFLGRMFDNNK